MDNEKLIAEAKTVLLRGDIVGIIGYQKDSQGFRVSPLFVRDERDIEKLFFSPLCWLSLVNYLTLEKGRLLQKGNPGKKAKVALMVRGCDSKALNQIIIERGLSRDEVYVFGIPCNGVIDLKKIEKMFPDVQGSAQVSENNGFYHVRCNGKSHEVPKEELIADSCKHCVSPNPILYDVLLYTPIVVKQPDYRDIEEIDNMSIAEKWEFWREQFSMCVRCYACRNACPLCYCDDCILERLSPQWIYRSVNMSENLIFHLARSFHHAGRCAGCGECERVCPVNLPLMLLNRKLEKDSKELFHYTVGEKAEQKPLLATFNPQDPDDFIF